MTRENKNATSTSFAVPDEKLAARKYLFNRRSMMHTRNNKSVTFCNPLPSEVSRNHVITPSMGHNRHRSRQSYGVSNSIDFITHSPISHHRLTADGGFFPINDTSVHQRCMGTAESGHGRQYLVTDFTKRIKEPHFSKRFNEGLQKNPKAYSFQKTEFTSILNSGERDKFVMRPSNHTFRVMRENYLKSVK